MNPLQERDVPYGDDWDSATNVAAWAEAADQKRPWRSQIRDHIADRIAELPQNTRVLDLGSGPGVLAQRVFERCPNLAGYTLLDFSEHMLALSRNRLSAFPAASFVLANFKSDEWPTSVGGPFECVVSMQAVHELRHKRHAPRLYEQIHHILTVPGLVMICDHTPFDESAASRALYMTEQEQRKALTDARLENVGIDLSVNGLVLYVGERAA
jgi:SAM-dependent methyltransferase